MPLITLLIYIVGTFFPLIYSYVPLLGQLKIVLVAGIVLLVSFIGTYNRYTNFTAYKNPIVYSWIGFLFFMIMGLFVSFDRGTTLTVIETNFKYLLVFLVMIKIVDDPKKLDKVILVFTLCGIGMALSAIYNYIFGTEVLTSGYKLEQGYRAIALRSGLFADPNDLALLFNSVLPFAIYFLLVKKGKLIPLLGVSVIIIGTMLTYSRAGFLGLCIIGLMFVLSFKVQKKYIFLVLACAVLFWSFAPDSYKDRIASITEWKVDEETGKTGTRMDSWKVAMIEGLNHPVFGVGAGSGVYVNGTAMNDWHAVHNAFVQVFLEIGLIGFLFYLSLFIIPFNQYKKYLKGNKGPKQSLDILYKMMIIGLVSFACTAFFTPNGYSPLLYVLTAFAVIGSEVMKKGATVLSLSPAKILLPQKAG